MTTDEIVHLLLSASRITMTKLASFEKSSFIAIACETCSSASINNNERITAVRHIDWIVSKTATTLMLVEPQWWIGVSNIPELAMMLSFCVLLTYELVFLWRSRRHWYQRFSSFECSCRFIHLLSPKSENSQWVPGPWKAFDCTSMCFVYTVGSSI